MAHPFISVAVPEGESTINTDYVIAFLRGADDGGPQRHKLILRTGLELFVHEDYDEVLDRIIQSAESVRS